MSQSRILNDFSDRIIGAAIAVHRALGPGLLEAAYEACLEYELMKAGFQVARQVLLPVVYENVKVDAGFRLDLVVNQSVIVELKSVERIERILEAQVHTYLRLTGIRLGLLINFNVTKLVDGVKRIVHQFPND